MGIRVVWSAPREIFIRPPPLTVTTHSFNWHTFLYALTSSNIDEISKLIPLSESEHL